MASWLTPPRFYNEYIDPSRPELKRLLDTTSLREISRQTGIARSMLQRLRQRDCTKVRTATLHELGALRIDFTERIANESRTIFVVKARNDSCQIRITHLWL